MAKVWRRLWADSEEGNWTEDYGVKMRGLWEGNEGETRVSAGISGRELWDYESKGRSLRAEEK